MFEFDAEAELQQELREMFAVDTQQQLEDYFRLIQQLGDRTWQADIQHLYRAIHTIKGGAVTVAADGLLHAAMVLEDLLSDLRYLEAAPTLADGKLEQILLEAGELLSSTIEMTEIGDAAILAVKPTVDRLNQLWELVKQLYLAEWDELKQVHQEFAEQGFELVILELEMALGNLPTEGIVSPPTLDIAQATIAQLMEIGADLELAPGWAILLKNCEQLINKPDSELWREIWVEYFSVLKTCVKNSGEIDYLEIDRLVQLADSIDSIYLTSTSDPVEPASIIVENPEYSADLIDILDDFFITEESELPSISASIDDDFDLPDLLDDFFMEEEIAANNLIANQSAEFADPLVVGLSESLNDLFDYEDTELVGLDTIGQERFIGLISAAPTSNQSEESGDPLVISLSESLNNLFDYQDTELVGLDAIGEERFGDLLSAAPTSNQPEESGDPLVVSLAESLNNLFDYQDTELVELDTIGEERFGDLLSIGRSDSLEYFLTDSETEDQILSDTTIIDESEFEDPLVGLTDSLDDFFGDAESELLSHDEISDLTLPTSESSEASTDLIDSLDAFFTYEEIELTTAEIQVNSILHPRPETESEAAEFTTWDQDESGEYAQSTVVEAAVTTPTETESEAAEFATWNQDESGEYAESTVVAPPIILPIETTTKAPAEPSKRSIQIPVPLERLDKSATQVVDTLLTARAVMNVSHQLQSQLKQLTNLTQESAQYVTRLRQLQDDYALLRNISDERNSENNVNLERYRQGYTTINRLLENILRMSELGQEIETATYQSSSRLDALDRSILNLKDGIETSRLIPFRNLTLRAKAILRDLTNRYHKPAQLIATNEQVELDAGIVQQLEPALLHLLRNAYDHGLESVAARESAGKPAQGTIKISLNRQGNLYRLVISDDGGGIDPAKIANIARSKNFPLHQTRTNAELLAVLCQPGFSSNSSVSEVSGRGVGMDVVATQIASIGGQMRLETTIGQGTTFSLEVPAPQLLVPCILLQVGERTIALPTDEVLETALMTSMAAEYLLESTNFCNWQLTTSQGQVPGFDLANYWQQFDSHRPQRSIPDTAICIRTRQPDGTAEIWSIADNLLGQAELLINPLPSPLIAPVGLLGVSLQADGTLISILDPSAITTSIATATAPTSSQTTAPASQPKSSAPVILIVDDAAMMRRRFEASLNANGFITHTCNDGLEALNWLQTNPHPDLMITDVEMPNMDGFTLIDRARQSNIQIPILVVSSRLSEEWGKEARRLGASDYLNKGFSTPELLQKVATLLNLAVV